MHLVLAGAGQAHLEVLRRFGRQRPAMLSALTVIAPEATVLHAPSMPAVAAGLLPPDAAQIPLGPLLEAAGARWLRDRITGLDPALRQVRRLGGGPLGYDLLSLNLGARPLATPPGTVPVRPWSALLPALAAAAQRPGRIAVIGGGLTGVELALALAHRSGQGVLLVEAGPRLLPHLPPRFAARLLTALRRAGVQVETDFKVLRLADGTLQGERAALPEIALGIACTGLGPPLNLAGSGLACGRDGFPLTDPMLRSPSHPMIFSAGETAATALQDSSAWARSVAPALARNLRRALQGQAPRRWSPPRRAGLLLVGAGEPHAIGLWRRWSFEGRWVWLLKRAMDGRLVARYRAPAAASRVPSLE
jgi:selenide,water dikinase